VKPAPRSPDNYPNHVEGPDTTRGRRVPRFHWWDPDRLNHLADMPRHCPACGNPIVEDGGLAVEYWEGDERVYHTWCHDCGWVGDITRVRRMIGHEAEH
jgi:hypothetical protein